MSEPIRYTRELLAKAAERCSTIEEVTAFLGTRPYGTLHRYLFKRFDHFGIDISHLPRLGSRGAKPRPTPEELRQAVDNSTSIATTLRSLGRPDNARLRTLFRGWIAEDGLDTSHFLGQAHQRGKPGTVPRKAAAEILVQHDGRRRTTTALLRRALRDVGLPERCDKCGAPPHWTGRPMTLEIDHINGDWSDDRRENLRLLCPNCHAITTTWCRGGQRQAS
ncbi:HNH endonuclease [Streptomyces sp. NBC_01381]|uniref:HNH endonuclease n=1 Tax=Streptomyces sp. NBC_01381 TaxID=2903845 RepID=UPI0022592EFF|nr:HNH endonuclease signature motif containing protein [Streptomyces sp. NBC_01381]MCX4666966.1 HNH endonuclease [Streptomyces sp. NBC_01381]